MCKSVLVVKDIEQCQNNPTTHRMHRTHRTAVFKLRPYEYNAAWQCGWYETYIHMSHSIFWCFHWKLLIFPYTLHQQLHLYAQHQHGTALCSSRCWGWRLCCFRVCIIVLLLLCVLCVLCVVVSFSAIRGPHWGYITANFVISASMTKHDTGGPIELPPRQHATAPSCLMAKPKVLVPDGWAN